MNVLIVEDNDQMRSFIKHIVIGWGHNTVEANNGLAGAQMFFECSPEVVLMDIHMSEMDGIEAARKIRQSSEDVRIIMVTDYDDDSLRRKSEEAGADDYLLKENLLELKGKLQK